MSKDTTSYRIKDENAPYYLTCATVNWINAFATQKCKEVFVDGLKFCIKNKGLRVFGWVLMDNHFHMIAMAKDGYQLSGIIRDFKKHVTKELIKVFTENNVNQNMAMIEEMLKAGMQNSKKQIHQLWQNDNHPIYMYKSETINQKLKYIHYNPVKADIVQYPEEYEYSSARNYAGLDGLIEVEFV